MSWLRMVPGALGAVLVVVGLGLWAWQAAVVAIGALLLVVDRRM